MTAKKKNKQPGDLLSDGALEQAPILDASTEQLSAEQQEDYMKVLRLNDAEIPAHYLGKTLENFRARSKLLKDVVEFAHNYADTFQRGKTQKGLFIRGCTGCGKSHIASAILQLVIDKGFTGYWCNVADLMNTIRDVMARSIPYEELDYVDAKCRDRDLLIMDDLGAEAPKGLTLQRLYSLVNRRYERQLPIIVTSNLEFEELSRQFDDQHRIMSRLGELCTRFAPFPNTDHRLKHLR